ncbi:MAG TPA: HYR domain-containing protein [Acidimicrobiales bacterium]|nr:HYR domain-containing protein [Acidimicrobiales bacterium]
MTRALARPTSSVLAALLVLSTLSVLAVATAPPSGATHLRATQLAWHSTPNPRVVVFDFTGSFRRSYFTAAGYQANVGNVVPITATDSSSGLFYGDGTHLAEFNATIVDSDTANDRITVDAHLTKTYAGTGTVFAAYYQNCCRLSPPAHRNNGDKPSRQETLVTLAPNVSGTPDSSVSPIVDCPVNALCTFFVPATDRDGGILSYRLATPAEASGAATGTNAFVQPGGATIDPATGLYSWNTAGASLAGGTTPSFFSTQVVVDKRLTPGAAPVTKLATDFFIRVNPATAANQAPQFVSPTPDNGTEIDGVAGQPVGFDVRATDSAAGDTVTLGTLALPAGATFTRTNGNPATGSFSWTPATPGDHFVTLTAADQFGLQATQRTVHIVVGDGTPPVMTWPGDQTLEATGPSGAIATFSATAMDETSGERPVTCTPASGSTFPMGQTTVSCTASDAAGNQATASGTITVVDTTGPQLSLGDVQAEATGPDGAPVGYTATAADVVDGSRPVSCTPAAGSLFPLGATTVQCSSSDSRGNASTGSFVVTVSDTTGPVLALPADRTAEATGPTGAAVTFPSSADDVVDGTVPVTCAPASGGVFPLGTTPVGCHASDAAGNTTTGGFDVKVVDTTGPAVHYTGPATVEATGPGGAAVGLTGNASDLVDGDLPATCATPAGATLPVGVHLVTCTATDAAGNTGSVEASVTVQDTTAPVVSVPGDAVVEATGPGGAPFSYTVSAADAVTPDLATSCSTDSGATFPLGTTHVTCTATDGAGNNGSATFAVAVVDTTGPVVSTPGTVTEEATGPGGAVVAFTATASDVVDGAVPVTCTPASGSAFPLGTTMVTCGAQDGRSNLAAPGTIAVVVRDTTAPTLVAPPDVTAEATGPGGAEVTYPAPAAGDAVDQDVAVVCQPPSGQRFALGATTVACTATDDAGNSSHASFTVTVADTTPPAVSVPPDVTVEATSGAGAAASFGAATASDVVDGSVPATCDRASGATFAIGTSIVTCTATDAAGNIGQGTFKVTVRDTTAPVVSTPADQVAEATGPAGAAVAYPGATALDTVDGPLPATCQPPSGSVFALGATVVSCHAADGAGNTGAGSFAVTVRDTTAPVVTAPGPVTAEATGPNGAAVTYGEATGADLVDGAVAASCSTASGSVFPLGVTTVTCTATDAHGNTGSATFSVTVRDTTAPAITTPGNLVVEATSPAGASAAFAVSATDRVDGTVAPTCSATSGSTFPLGTTTVACKATDTRGNTGSASFTVTVRDTVAPTVSYAGNQGTYALDETVHITCSAADSGSGVASSTCADIVGPAWSFGVGAHTFSATATDRAGNVGTGSTTFTVAVSSATLCSLTRQFATKAGVAQSLCVKLTSAQAAADRRDVSGGRAALQDYRNEVRAQAGKAMTADQAALLDALAGTLSATW